MDEWRALLRGARTGSWPHRHFVLVRGTEVSWCDTARESVRAELIDVAVGMMRAVGVEVPPTRRSRVWRLAGGAPGRVGVLRPATVAEVLALSEAV